MVIPAPINAVLGDDTVCPQKWPKSRFDMVWLLTRSAADAGFAFSQVPRCLLFGDAADPIPLHHDD
jgi:hypothetical protein